MKDYPDIKNDLRVWLLQGYIKQYVEKNSVITKMITENKQQDHYKQADKVKNGRSFKQVNKYMGRRKWSGKSNLEK